MCGPETLGGDLAATRYVLAPLLPRLFSEPEEAVGNFKSNSDLKASGGRIDGKKKNFLPAALKD